MQRWQLCLFFFLSLSLPPSQLCTAYATSFNRQSNPVIQLYVSSSPAADASASASAGISVNRHLVDSGHALWTEEAPFL